MKHAQSICNRIMSRELFENNLSSWDKAIARKEYYMRAFSLHNILLLAWLEPNKLRNLLVYLSARFRI